VAGRSNSGSLRVFVGKKQRRVNQALPSGASQKPFQRQCLILLFAFVVMLLVQGRVVFFFYLCFFYFY